MTNTNIEKIVNAVALKLASYTEPNSITPAVMTETIAIAIQSLYAPTDVFLANNGVDEIDLSSYINIKRLFAKMNNFTSLDLTPMTELEYVDFGANYFTVKTVDFSQNNKLKTLLLQGFMGFSSLPISNLSDLRKLYIGNNDLIADFSFMSNNYLLESVEVNLSGVIEQPLNLSIYPNLKYFKGFCESVTTVNTTGLTNLNTINLDAPITVDFSTNSSLKNITIEEYRGNIADYENILSNLVSFGLLDGSLSVRFTNGKTPVVGVQGLADIAILESRGWYVYAYN